MAIRIEMADECSGTSILDDGRRVYWTEGHGDMVVRHPDGRTETVPTHQPSPTLDTLTALDETGYAEYRTATEADETEWAAARAG